MTDKVAYLTPEGLEKLRQELNNRTHVLRREIAARIQEAKELGDLSENAEYHGAKEEQAFNEGRIEELEVTLRQAVLITEDAGDASGVVRVGSTVETKQGSRTMSVSLVGSNEADPLTGKISNESPIGQALLGKRVGDLVTVKTPNGDVEYSILKVA